MTELQKRFEADAYKQKMNYAGSAGIAANEQVLLQVWNSLLVLPGTAAQ